MAAVGRWRLSIVFYNSMWQLHDTPRNSVKATCMMGVLLLAEIELVASLVAGTGLRFGVSTRTMLTTN